MADGDGKRKLPVGLKCGYLTKQGEVVKSWKLRYFTLSWEYLTYYGSDQKKIAHIDLRECEAVTEATDVKRSFCFRLSFPNPKDRTYVIQAANAIQMTEWLVAIRALVTLHKRHPELESHPLMPFMITLFGNLIPLFDAISETQNNEAKHLLGVLSVQGFNLLDKFLSTKANARLRDEEILLATETLQLSIDNMGHILEKESNSSSQLIPRLRDQIKSIIDTIRLNLGEAPPKLDSPTTALKPSNPTGTPQIEKISPRTNQLQAQPSDSVMGTTLSAPNLKAHLAQSSLNILTRNVPKLAISNPTITNAQSALNLISPPSSPSASRLRAAVEGRMSLDNDNTSDVDGDRAETTQEAIIREARTIGKSYPKLLECSKLNASPDDFKAILAETAASLRKVKSFADEIAAHTRNKDVVRKLFGALKHYVLQWNGEAQSMTELFQQQNIEQLQTSLDKGQEKMKNELAQLADTLTEAVQQQLIETEFREATILFLQDTFEIEDVETNQRNKFIAKLIRLAKGLVSITSNVFEQPELGPAEKEGMMSKLEKLTKELENMSGIFLEQLRETPQLQTILEGIVDIRDFAQLLITAIQIAISEGWDQSSQLQISAVIKQMYPFIKDLVHRINNESKKPQREVSVELTKKNIWSEPVSPYNLTYMPEEDAERYAADRNFKLVGAGTLNALILNLTSPTIADLDFQKTFVATYRSFMTPEEFFEKLLECYDVQQPMGSLTPEQYQKTVVLPVRLRVCNILTAWIGSAFIDLDGPLLERIENFCNTRLVQDNFEGLKTKILTSIKKAHEAALHNRRQSSILKQGKLFNPKEIKKLPAKTLLDVPSMQVAEQLTWIDWQIFSQIASVEFLNSAWNNDKYRDRSLNLRKMIMRFNATSMWVASNIMWQERLKDRVAVVVRLIQIAKDLIDIHNYNSAMAIVAGLNNASVARLKFTWAEIPKPSKKMKEQVESLLDSSGSYKNYRTALKSTLPPVIPYLGIYLSDLTFIEDGNPNMLGPQINFHKRRLVYRVIAEVQQCQQQAYTITPVDRVQSVLKQLAYANEKELYELSLIHEPRNVVDKDEIR